jgi:hypothetical protein
VIKAKGVIAMPEKKTIERAKKAKRKGRSATTQAGEFVREEIRHIRQGKHGARSAKQAIAIGLSKARRAGVDLPPPEKGKTSEKTRKSAESAWRAGHHGEPAKRKPSTTRSRAIHRALQREGTSAASHEALSKQAHSAARQRTAAERSAAAKAAARTKGAQERHQAAEKAIHTKGHAGLARAARKAAKTRAAHK